MSAWLAAAEVAVVTAAVVGAVFLRRHADREWAEIKRRQQIALALPQMQQMAKALIQVRITIQDSFTPALREAVASIAELGAALDALPRLPWHKRAWLRVRGWFA